jgi:DNA polymerase-3 subunit gamma/tau
MSTENYQILALKWRPKKLNDLIGQDHISQTLIRAFELNRIPQAFLFSGPRGVGKTTSARLVALALNAEDKPTVNYNLESERVQEIIDGSSLDVIEIDGASNRGIDEIRELRDSINFMPVNSSYKVIIIDEVHMLTTQAFNALLKTIEEPPQHVKFIFATTDVHKVPQTIISRCQRYDFLPLTLSDIVNRLNFILKEEKISFEQEILEMIAQKSEGSMRDALGFLDQVLVYQNSDISKEEIQNILGIVSDVILFEISDSIHAKNAEKLLAILDQIEHSGFSIEEVLKNLIIHFKNLILINLSQTTLLRVSPEILKKYQAVSYSWSDRDLIRISNILSNLYAELKHYADQFVIFQLTILKLIHFDKTIDIQTLLSNASEESPVVKAPESVVNEKAAPSVASQSSTLNFDEIQENWTKILQLVRSKRASIAALLTDCILSEFDGTTLKIISYDRSDFNKRLLEGSIPLIEQSFKDSLNMEISVEIVIDTSVEKIEESKNLSIEEDDAISIFGGKEQ